MDPGKCSCSFSDVTPTTQPTERPTDAEHVNAEKPIDAEVLLARLDLENAGCEQSSNTVLDLQIYTKNLEVSWRAAQGEARQQRERAEAADRDRAIWYERALEAEKKLAEAERRERIATAALQGLAANSHLARFANGAELVALAVKAADDLIAALDAKGDGS